MMPKSKIIFESTETVTGYNKKTRDLIEYSGLLRIRDSGKQPVTLDLDFVPPHPFAIEVPLKKHFRGTSISDVFVKLTRFFKTYGCELRSAEEWSNRQSF